jgi:integrase
MAGTLIVSYRVRIKTHRDRNRYYYAEFRAVDGTRFEKVLKSSGEYIPASPTASVEKGKNINGESSRILTDVFDAIFDIRQKLEKEGAFMQHCSLTLKSGMDMYLDEYNQKRRNPKMNNHAKQAIQRFGETPLNEITFAHVKEWVADLDKTYSFNTIKNTIDAPKRMINWLIKNEKWAGKNNFSGHEFTGTGNTRDVKPKITPGEWAIIKSVCDDPMLEQAIVQGCLLGIRPSEVYRIMPNDYDHRNLMLNVHVEKAKKKYSRWIAISEQLSVWALNHQDAWETLNENTINNKMGMFRERLVSMGHTGLYNLCMESFRYNFSSFMEDQKVTLEIITAHQGRYQSDVIIKHYLNKDPMRAVRLMRPYIDLLFPNTVTTPRKRIRLVEKQNTHSSNAKNVPGHSQNGRHLGDDKIDTKIK